MDKQQWMAEQRAVLKTIQWSDPPTAGGLPDIDRPKA